MIVTGGGGIFPAKYLYYKHDPVARGALSSSSKMLGKKEDIRLLLSGYDLKIDPLV